MKIKPLSKIIQIKLEEAKAGVLDTSSRESAVEYAEVLEIGENCGDIRKGDSIFVKAWAIDIITHNDKRYYFVNTESNGILATVK